MFDEQGGRGAPGAGGEKVLSRVNSWRTSCLEDLQTLLYRDLSTVAWWRLVYGSLNKRGGLLAVPAEVGHWLANDDVGQQFLPEADASAV